MSENEMPEGLTDNDRRMLLMNILRHPIFGEAPERADLGDRLNQTFKNIAALRAELAEKASLELALAAEKHNHLKDNEHWQGKLTEAKARIEELEGAIDAEPELPGPMPDEMWEVIRCDRDAAEDIMKDLPAGRADEVREAFD